MFSFPFSLVFSRQDCYLVSILNELAGNSFMVFCGTCNNTQRTALMLRNLGLMAIPLHGQMGQVDKLSLHSQLNPEAAICLLCSLTDLILHLMLGHLFKVIREIPLYTHLFLSLFFFLLSALLALLQ